MHQISFPTSERISTSLSAPDKHALDMIAYTNGLSTAALVRSLILKYAPQEYPTYQRLREEHAAELIANRS